MERNLIERKGKKEKNRNEKKEGAEKRKTGRRILSLALAVVLTVLTAAPQFSMFSVAAQEGTEAGADTASAQTKWSAAVSQETLQNEEIQEGKLLLKLLDHDGKKLITDVLYRESDGMVWINAEIFEPYFSEYEYTYTTFTEDQNSGGYVVIRAYQREFAFRTGSSTSVYRIGGTENFYSLQEKVIAYNQKAWIPADDLFYYLCCSSCPVYAQNESTEAETAQTTETAQEAQAEASQAAEIEQETQAAQAAEAAQETQTAQMEETAQNPEQSKTEENWTPLRDYLLLSDPQYTIVDILCDIYADENALYWMFDYERDFGVTQEEMNKVLAAADLALSLYGAATLDWKSIAYTATLPVTALKNKLSGLTAAVLGWEETEESRGLFQDGIYAELFINAMANSGEEQVTQMQEIDKKTREVFTELLGDSAKAADIFLDGELEELVTVFHSIEDDRLYGIFYKEFDSLVDATVSIRLMDGIQSFQLLDETQTFQSAMKKLNTAVKAGKVGMERLNLILTAVSVYQQSQTMDELMTEAMSRYLTESRYSTVMDESMYFAFTLQISQWNAGQKAYVITETISSEIEELIDNAVKGASPTGLAAIITDLGWSLFESSELYPEELLARSDEPKSLKLSLYGRVYEYDAWKTLTEYYVDYVQSNGYCMEDQLETCAYLALNYLKACYVTTDAALNALSGSEIKEEFTYQKTERKRKELAKLMAALEQDLSCLKKAEESGKTEEQRESLQTVAFGVPFQQLMRDNELTWDLFLHPDLQEEGQSYGYSCPPLQAAGRGIAPLVAHVDYYAFLRNELLPSLGLTEEDPTSHLIANNNDGALAEINWDVRSGLLGADVVDLNGDGSTDFLVYLMEEDADAQAQNGSRWEQLCAELYSVTEEGTIALIASQALTSCNDLSYDRVKIGLMERENQIFLYVEIDGIAYYADGGSVSYTWYGWDEKGALRPFWMVGKTDGGSSCLACSLLCYEDSETYSKYVLCADGEFRYTYPDVEIYADDWSYNAREALEAGFFMLDLPAPGVYETSENGYFAKNGSLPTYWGTQWMKESVSYLCTGSGAEAVYDNEGNYQGTKRTMRVSWEDRSGLREKLEEIGWETQVGDYWSNGSIVAAVDTQSGLACDAEGITLLPIRRTAA